MALLGNLLRRMDRSIFLIKRGTLGKASLLANWHIYSNVIITNKPINKKTNSVKTITIWAVTEDNSHV